MGTRLPIALVLLLVAVLISAIVAYHFRSPSALDPVYQRRRLSAWLQDVNPSTDQLPPASAEAVRSMGTNALPYLLQQCGLQDSDFRELLGAAKEHGIPGFNGFRSADWYRRRAIRGLQALGTIGLEAAISGLTNSDKRIRWGCVAAIFEIAGNSTSVVQPLVERLSDSAAEVRAQAAATMGVRGQKPEIVVPALIHTLDDTNDLVKAMAAYGLGFFQVQARPAVPALLRTMTNIDPSYRFYLTNALLAIDPQAAAKAGIK